MKKLLYRDSLDTPASAGLLMVRLICGAAMMIHGWSKIQNPMGWMGPGAPVPGILQALAAISEFGGGLAWIIGLLTPLASFGLVCTMAVAAWTHYSKGDPYGKYELALAYFSVAFLMMFSGAGRFSLDALIFGRGADKPSQS